MRGSMGASVWSDGLRVGKIELPARNVAVTIRQMEPGEVCEPNAEFSDARWDSSCGCSWSFRHRTYCAEHMNQAQLSPEQEARLVEAVAERVCTLLGARFWPADPRPGWDGSHTIAPPENT